MEVYDRERIVKLYDSYSDEMKEDVDYCYLLDESYSDIEEEYGFLYESDLFQQFVFAGVGTAQKDTYAFERISASFREIHNNVEIADDELLVLIATEIAKFCKNKVDQRSAQNQGEDWKHDSEKVDYYGSKVRAESRGYDRYMDSHAGGDYRLLNAVIDECSGRYKTNGKH